MKKLELFFKNQKVNNIGKLKFSWNISSIRLSWSLQYSTIPDFINSVYVKPGQEDFSVPEVTLFCQCLHNFHLMESIDENLKTFMAQSALRILDDFHKTEMNENHNLSEQLYQGME